MNVEAITFNKGYYTVDVTYFYKITGETFPGGNTVTGLAIFDKRVMLCGGEGTVKTFSSDLCDCSCVDDGMPTAYVEAVDPIALHLKLVDANCNVCCDNDRHDIPACILARFGEALVTTDTGRRLYVTLGQFSIIRLEAAHPGLRLLRAREGMRRRPLQRRPLRDLLPDPLPRRGVLPLRRLHHDHQLKPKAAPGPNRPRGKARPH